MTRAAAEIANLLEIEDANPFRIRREVPPAVSQLLHIPGLGRKRVRALWRELGIESLEQLRQSAGDGRIRGLPGFGEQKILQAVEAHLSKKRRVSWPSPPSTPKR